LKNNKSAGLDNILAEYLKGGGDVTVKTLTNICNRVWKQEEVPDDWRNGIIIPLPKKVISPAAQTGGVYLSFPFLEKSCAQYCSTG
jgi:hypothetical protein